MPPAAGTLLATHGGFGTVDTNLYTVDPVTVALAAIGDTGHIFTGLAFDPTDDTLYGVTGNLGTAPRTLFTIDPDTAAVTPIGALGSTVADICFDDAGQMYGWKPGGASGGANRLTLIDKATGTLTDRSASGLTSTAGCGLSFLAGVLYVAPKGADGDLYTADTATGAVASVGTMVGVSGDNVAGMATRSGVLWGIGTNSGKVFTLGAPSGGTVTLTVVGTLETTDSGWDSLAAVPASSPPPDVPPAAGAFFQWRLIVTDLASATLTILDRRSSGRQFLFTLGAPAYHTGQVASDDPEINIPTPTLTSPALLSNNVRLLYGLRREPGATPPYVCRFGGIVMNLEDQSGDSPTARYTAYDPRQLLMSRPVRDPDTGALPGQDGLTFPTGSKASDIALGILLATEVVDGPTFIDLTTDGLDVEDTDPISGEFRLDAGLMVGEAWAQLEATGTIDILLPPLYDPKLKPGKVCSLRIRQQAGSVRHDAVMAWDRASRSVANVSRLVDGTRLADKVRFYAGSGGPAVPTQTDAAAVAAYGEYWAQQFFPGSENAALVELLAIAELLIRRNGQRTIAFDPAPERAPLVLRDYGLGDYLPLWASRALREPISVDYAEPDPSAAGYQRVYAIPLTLDDDGTERPTGLLTSRDTTG